MITTSSSLILSLDTLAICTVGDKIPLFVCFVASSHGNVVVVHADLVCAMAVIVLICFQLFQFLIVQRINFKYSVHCPTYIEIGNSMECSVSAFVMSWTWFCWEWGLGISLIFENWLANIAIVKIMLQANVLVINYCPEAKWRYCVVLVRFESVGYCFACWGQVCADLEVIR